MRKENCFMCSSSKKVKMVYRVLPVPVHHSAKKATTRPKKVLENGTFSQIWKATTPVILGRTLGRTWYSSSLWFGLFYIGPESNFKIFEGSFKCCFVDIP
jgi:hypothetical protein